MSKLREAKEILHGGDSWTQWRYRSDDFPSPCFCAVGALNASYDIDPEDEDYGVREPASDHDLYVGYLADMHALSLEARASWDLPAPPAEAREGQPDGILDESYVLRWNDFPGRTVNQVLDLFDRAAHRRDQEVPA